MADLLRKATKWSGSLTRPGIRRYLALGSLAGAGISAVALGGAHKAEQWRANIMKGLYPGSALPVESGRFGVRTNRSQAGVDGLRFNFRRK